MDELSRIYKALEDTGIVGIYDIFVDATDAIAQMALWIKDLEEERKYNPMNCFGTPENPVAGESVDHVEKGYSAERYKRAFEFAVENGWPQPRGVTGIQANGEEQDACWIEYCGEQYDEDLSPLEVIEAAIKRESK